MGFTDYFIASGRGKSEGDIEQYRTVFIEQWLPDQNYEESYGVFGGNEDQRNLIVEQGIARAFGKMGIIVLHNNDSLENDLKHILNCYPDLERYYANTPMAFVNYEHRDYMPLLGMDENRAAEVIYPQGTSQSPMYLQQHIYASALRSYLKLLRYCKVPITISNLQKICRIDLNNFQMPDGIPEVEAKEILANLSQDQVMNQVRADVDGFASQLRSRIWGGQENTGVSILTAIQNKALLSIQLPTFNETVMNYLAAELNQVLESGMPCLLVIDSVNVENSEMRRLMVNPGGRLSMILSGNTVQELCSVTNLGNELSVRFRKLILLQCANAGVAMQYSELIGNYMKKVITQTENTNKGVFELFGSRGRGTAITEQQYARIRPEELTNLRNGAVLIDQENSRIQYAVDLKFA